MATKLKDRDKVGLDETRMIVLVVQVLLGFECRAAFEPAFERLPAAAQAIKMISFGLLVVTLAFLLGIPASHRVAENGESTLRVETYLRRMMTYALWPFALGLDLGIATLSVLRFQSRHGCRRGSHYPRNLRLVYHRPSPPFLRHRSTAKKHGRKT